jgi:hypothetical protein
MLCTNKLQYCSLQIKLAASVPAGKGRCKSLLFERYSLPPLPWPLIHIGGEFAELIAVSYC